MKSITCHVCGMTSWHYKDVEEGYCGNCHAFTGRPPVMTTYTVFDRPKDFPDRVVVRGFDIFSGMGDAVPQPKAYLFHDVDTARAWLRQEFPEKARFAPDPLKDDPNMVETWV